MAGSGYPGGGVDRRQHIILLGSPIVYQLHGIDDANEPSWGSRSTAYRHRALRFRSRRPSIKQRLAEQARRHRRV